MARTTADSEGNVYAPANGPEGEGIYRSIDGRDWDRLPLPASRRPYFVSANRSRGIAITAEFERNHRLFVSDDAGVSWKEVGLPEEVISRGARALAIGEKGELYLEANRGFFASGGLFRSSDGGRTWRRLADLPLPWLPAKTTAMVIGRDDILYIGIGAEQQMSAWGQVGGKILSSKDGGETWATLRVLGRLERPIE